MNDPTILNNAATEILTALEDAANEIGWAPMACVTAGEPSFDCDSLHVWVGGIEPIKDGAGAKCHIVSRVTFNYSITTCFTGAKVEGCAFWDAHAPGVHDHVWQVWIGLVRAVLAGICGTGQCSDQVKLSTLNLTSNQGGIIVYQGSLTVDLSPSDLPS